MSNSIRCPKCGTINTNKDYCENCGFLINTHLRRELERRKKQEQKLREKEEKGPSKGARIAKTALEHPNFLIRYFSKTIYAIWAFIGLLIGALIAGVIALASG